MNQSSSDGDHANIVASQCSIIFCTRVYQLYQNDEADPISAQEMLAFSEVKPIRVDNSTGDFPTGGHFLQHAMDLVHPTS